MKVIKLDRRYHGFPRWTHALQFTRREVHPRYREHMPYVTAFMEVFGKHRTLNQDENSWEVWTNNPDWDFDVTRRRIYIKDPNIMTFIQLKLK